MATVLRGPWMQTTLPPNWFVSFNDGASAFSVMADSYDGAACAAHDRLYEEIVGAVNQDDPFALDAAETEVHALMAKARIYSPQEWTEHVLAEAQQSIRARWPNWTPQGVA